MLHDFCMLSAWGGLIVLVLFTLTWLLSLKLDNFSFVDVTWSFSLAFLAPLYAIAGHGFITRRLLAAAMALIWSVRLGSYLFVRVARHHPHEDVRYQVLRTDWEGRLRLNFFGFFQAQALLILLLSFPVLLACLNSSPQVSAIEWLGAAVWLLGIVGEACADAQMAAFKRAASSKGKVCQAGLWR